MAAALPVTKIAALLVKTLAKPVSKRIKHEFSKNTTTAAGLVWIGQTSHQITSRLTIWSAGYKVRTVQPLEANEALKVGSEFVGETFILGVSVIAVVWEYNRSKDKERIKEQKIHDKAAAERAELQAKLRTLDKRLHALEIVVQQNNDSLLRVIQGKPKYIKPTDGIVPIDTDDNNNNNNNLNDATKTDISSVNNNKSTTSHTPSKLSIFLKGGSDKNSTKGGTINVSNNTDNNNNNNNSNNIPSSTAATTSSSSSLPTTASTTIGSEGENIESSTITSTTVDNNEISTSGQQPSSSSGWKRWIWPFF